jgi:phosphomannomutase
VKLDESDGLKIDTPDWWIHLRKSNTEPIIRVIGEARTKELATQWCEKFMSDIVALSKEKL